MVAFGAAVQSQREEARGRTVVVGAKSELADRNFIDLDRSSVQTIFSVDRSIQKDSTATAEQAFQPQIAGVMLGGEWRIDGAADVAGYRDVAVGAESFSAAYDGPRPNPYGPVPDPSSVLELPKEP